MTLFYRSGHCRSERERHRRGKSQLARDKARPALSKPCSWVWFPPEGGSWVCLRRSVCACLLLASVGNGNKGQEEDTVIRGLCKRHSSSLLQEVTLCEPSHCHELCVHAQRKTCSQNPGTPPPRPKRVKARQAQGGMKQDRPLCALRWLPDLGEEGES